MGQQLVRAAHDLQCSVTMTDYIPEAIKFGLTRGVIIC